MNETLSNIVADLFARSQGSEEIASHILRLRTEINKGTDRDDAVYGKFRGLLESFRDVIPDEKQRYHAAIKALSTTSKLSQQEIVKSIGGQAEELKILEKSLLSPLPAWRDELRAMEAKAKLKSDEIAKLREQMVRLEAEEEGIRKGKAARERIMDLAEMAMKELFADIVTEVASLKKKAEEFSAESAAVQPVPRTAPPKLEIPAASTISVEQKVEVNAAPAPVDSGLQKKCPMCGGKMDLLINERMWQCYSCAYEEPETATAQGTGEANSARTAPLAVPVADPSFNEYQEPKKRSSAKTKTCPSCRKKMFWHPEENAWRCPSCFYETRSLS